MSAILDLILRLQDNATPGLNNTRSAIEGVGSAASGAGGGFSILKGAASYVIGGAVSAGFNAIKNSVGGLVGGMISGNAQFETYNQQFGVLLGSAEAAKDRMAELAQFGATTPFELPQVVEADKILQGFGLHSEEAAAKFGYSGVQIRTIAGDVASGTGASFQEMSLLLGKFSAGATGEAISRMQEMGITTREELAQMGLEFSNSGQLLSPLPESMAVVLGIMEDKYGGMMAAQSTTFAGMMSNLEDWKAGTIRRLGEPIFEVVRTQLSGVLEYINSPAVMTAIDGFADMLAGGIGTAVDWFTNTALPAIQEFFGWLTNEGIPQFQAFAEPIIATIVPALLQLSDWFATNVAPLIEAAAQFVSWKDILIVLGGILLSLIIPALLTMAATILTIAAPIVAAIAIVALLRTAWENNWGGIQEKVRAVIDWLLPFVSNAIQAIKDWWAANGEEILAKAAAIWEAIKAAVETAVNLISTIITTVIAAVRAFWAENGDAILAKASEIWTAIKTAVTTAITEIQTIITTVATAVAAFWTEHGEAIKAKAEEIWTAIKDFIDGVWTTIKSLFAAFKSAFEGDWTAFGTHLREAWDAAWEAIKNLISSLWSVIQPILASLISNMISKFTDTDWGAVGRGIIDGIAHAISAGAGAIADAARSAAQAALDAAKAFLGISSPSKRAMLEIGRPFDEGVAGPIAQGKAVKAAVGSLTGILSGQMDGLQKKIAGRMETAVTGGFTPRAAAAPQYEGMAAVMAQMAQSGQPRQPALAAADAGGIKISIDARGSHDPKAVEKAGYEGAKRALREAGYRADAIRRTR